MGKKRNQQKAQKTKNEKDFLEARAIRKREQHKQRHAEKDRKEKIIEEVDVQQWKEQHREKKQVRWPDDALREDQLDGKKEIQKITTKQSTNDDLKEYEESKPVLKIPAAPRFDKNKVSECIAKKKLITLSNLSLHWKKKEIITEDMITLNKIPRFNGISKAVGQVVNEMKKHNEQRLEEIEVKEAEQKEKIHKVLNEEFDYLMDSRKYEIALEELKSILATKSAPHATSAEEEVEEKNLRIPSKEKFNEVTKTLRSFITARNENLKLCFNADFRRNKVADNYTHIFFLFERYKYLNNFVIKKRLANKTMGIRVLQVSVVLLHKMKEKLRKQCDLILTTNSNRPSQTWNKKINKYYRLTETHRNNIARMKANLVEKKEKVTKLRSEERNSFEELERAKIELEQSRQNFDISVKESDEYKKIKLIGKRLSNQISDVKNRIKQDVLDLKPLRKSLCSYKHKERDLTYLEEEIEKLRKEIKLNVSRRAEMKKQQTAIKELIRTQNGEILKHEIFQEELTKLLLPLKYENVKLEKSVDVALYQGEKLRKKFHLVIKQGRCLQRYQKCGKLEELSVYLPCN